MKRSALPSFFCTRSNVIHVTGVGERLKIQIIGHLHSKNTTIDFINVIDAVQRLNGGLTNRREQKNRRNPVISNFALCSRNSERGFEGFKIRSQRSPYFLLLFPVYFIYFSFPFNLKKCCML